MSGKRIRKPRSIAACFLFAFIRFLCRHCCCCCCCASSSSAAATEMKGVGVVGVGVVVGGSCSNSMFSPVPLFPDDVMGWWCWLILPPALSSRMKSAAVPGDVGIKWFRCKCLLEEDEEEVVDLCSNRSNRPRQKRMYAYSVRAPKMNRMQANIHASIAVNPSALGVFVVTVLKMLTKTRNKVTNKAIRPIDKYSLINVTINLKKRIDD